MYHNPQRPVNSEAEHILPDAQNQERLAPLTNRKPLMLQSLPAISRVSNLAEKGFEPS